MVLVLYLQMYKFPRGRSRFSLSLLLLLLALPLPISSLNNSHTQLYTLTTNENTFQLQSTIELDLAVCRKKSSYESVLGVALGLEISTGISVLVSIGRRGSVFILKCFSVEVGTLATNEKASRTTTNVELDLEICRRKSNYRVIGAVNWCLGLDEEGGR